MEPDPVKVSQTRQWLSRAFSDLRAGKHELDAVPPILDDLVFHAQQAAEKALKALLTWHDEPFRKTHSLEELGELCLSLAPGLRPLVDLAVPLTEYAWRYRYPGEPEEPDLEEALPALEIAESLYQAVVDLVPPEARPVTRQRDS